MRVPCASKSTASSRETGRAPSVDGIAAALDREPAAINEAFATLADSRAIVLHPQTGALWMAHPFSAVPTPYPVRAGAVSYWANCAWDVFGIAAVLGRDIEALARCPDCGESIDLSVRAGAPASPAACIHFTVSPLRFWDNIGFT